VVVTASREDIGIVVPAMVVVAGLSLSRTTMPGGEVAKGKDE